MHFSKFNNSYQVSWVSGPRHNKLAITLSENDDSETVIKALPPIGECRHAKLSEERILTNVLEGVERANETFNSKFRVSKVEYIENDTGLEEIFNFLTQKIIEHLVKGESFDEEV